MTWEFKAVAESSFNVPPLVTVIVGLASPFALLISSVPWSTEVWMRGRSKTSHGTMSHSIWPSGVRFRMRCQLIPEINDYITASHATIAQAAHSGGAVGRSKGLRIRGWINKRSDYA